MEMDEDNFLLAEGYEDGIEAAVEYKGYPSNKEYLEDHLYSITGNISDIHKMDSFPATIQGHIFQYQNTFSCILNEGRMMKCDPVKIKIQENALKPWKCMKA